MNMKDLAAAESGRRAFSTRASGRSLVAFAALALAAIGSFQAAHAQSTWPTRPVRVVIMVAAGGGADNVGRFIADRLTGRLGQAVVVENKTGAGGNIGTEFVARAPADGYTFLLTTNSHTLNPLIYQRAGYEKSDFASVIELCEGPIVLATAVKFPWKSLKDVVDEAKAKPGTLAYGSSGIGLPVHIAAELFKQAANIDLVHVPYKGAGQSVADAIGGQVPLVMASLSAVSPHIQTEKLRALGITGSTRWANAPDIPTMAEQGYPVNQMTWLGILAPRGTPQPIVERMNREINAVLALPEVKERLLAQGFAPVGKSPADFDAMLDAETELHRKLVARLGLKAE
jgi:tripartite-type tricarboxylate transporter receptor subunit TctC